MDPQPRPPKRQRRSRFAPSAAAAALVKAVPTTPTATPVADVPPPPGPSSLEAADTLPEAPTFQNSAVALLRQRTASVRHADAPANPPKRRRTRFSTAPAPAATSAAPSPPQPSLQPTRLDVTSIPVAPVSTLRINRNAAQQRRVARVLKVSEQDLLDTDPMSNPYYDASLRASQRDRRAARPEFRFVPEGKIVAQAELQREQAVVQAKTHEYRKKLIESGKEAEAVPVLPPLAEDLRAGGPIHHVPEFEWWDAPFLLRAQENGQPVVGDDDISRIVVREDRITHYIHHPPPITPAIPKKPPPVIPLMLTKKETKKLRRQRRTEAQKEKQEMIAVGLLPPPPPKVKLSNLMRVLASEATADPTKVEADVRAQVEERRQKHEAENEARKKSKEEKREKAHQKIEKDKESGMYAAVFRVGDMRNPQHRFKVDISARQLELSGILLLFPDCNMIVVEGGAKVLRKYKKLMLRRIDWNSEFNGDSNVADGNEVRPSESAKGTDSEQRQLNSCVLVWEGPISSPSFGEFNTVNAPTFKDCRYHLRKHGVGHYWDLCAQANPTGNENLGVRQLD